MMSLVEALTWEGPRPPGKTSHNAALRNLLSGRPAPAREDPFQANNDYSVVVVSHGLRIFVQTGPTGLGW